MLLLILVLGLILGRVVVVDDSQTSSLSSKPAYIAAGQINSQAQQKPPQNYAKKNEKNVIFTSRRVYRNAHA